MEFRDFTIRIGESVEGIFPVSVTCPAGDRNGQFDCPIDTANLSALLENNGLKTRGPVDVKPPDGVRGFEPVTAASVEELKDIGRKLFGALFQGEVAAAYAESKGRLGADEGLRLIVQPAQDIRNYAELMSLPWEYLYDDRGGRGEFVALEENMVITRFPEAPTPVRPSADVKSPLKILAMSSEPKDYAKLGIKQELVSLQEIDGIDVKILENAKIEDLAREARQGDYNVFHFMGHGGLEPDSGKSSLIFENADGTGRHVTGEALRRALGNSINLVFLNACGTARIGDEDPFAAISTELAVGGAAGGIPAVVAMQFPISDRAAIKLSAEFYQRVAAGVPVDHALSEARTMLTFDMEISTEWGTPVLFMRSPDGAVFNIEKADADADPVADQPGAPA